MVTVKPQEMGIGTQSVLVSSVETGKKGERADPRCPNEKSRVERLSRATSWEVLLRWVLFQEQQGAIEGA